MTTSFGLSPHRVLPADAPVARRLRLEAAGLSDVGCNRFTNEDSLVVAPEVAPGVGFLAVADGVGGSPAGDVASRMAVDLVLEEVRDAALNLPPRLGPRTLELTLREANAAVRAAAAADPAKCGMASTFTGLLVLPDRAFVGHAGDSRAYLLRGRRLKPLTEDDSLANACVQAGAMTRAEAEASPVRNQLVRGVGINEVMKMETRALAIAPGDLFMLSTDGLHGVLADREIETVLLCEQDLHRAASELVTRANDAGGPDNITVVLARVA